MAMTLQEAKEQLLTYVKQFETNAAVGLPVDRRRRTLLRRISDYKLAKQAYLELMREGEIHETGRGFGNQPVIVVLGNGPGSRAELPVIHLNVPTDALNSFIIKIMSATDFNCSLSEMQDHIRRALDSYSPQIH